MKANKLVTKIFISIIFLLAFFTVVLFLHPNCQRAPSKVKIGYLPIDASLPFFVAKEKGYFQSEGIEVEAIKFTSSTTLTDALVSGQVNIIVAAAIGGLLSLEENSPGQFKIFVLNLHNFKENKFSDRLLVRKDSPIKNLEDLRGKILGIPSGPMAQIFAKRILKGIFNDEKAMKIVPLSFTELVNALAGGSVDAIIVTDPEAINAIEKGIARSILDAPQERYVMDPLPASGYALSSSFIQRRPKEAKKIVKAIIKAIDFIRQNEEEARKLMAKNVPLEEKIALKMNLREWQKPEEINKKAVKELAELLFQEGMLKKKPEVYEIYYLPPK